MWRDQKLDSADAFAELRQEAIRGQRVYIVSEDIPTAKAWAVWREMPGGERSPQFVSSPQMLYGVSDRDPVTIVVIQGVSGKVGWKAMRTRLSVADAAGVPVMYDQLPGDKLPTEPHLGGCMIPTRGQPNRLPYQPSQGDVFLLRAHGGDNIRITRDQVDVLIEMLTAWRNGTAPRDPEAERAAAIRELIAATGNPFAGDATP